MPDFFSGFKKKFVTGGAWALGGRLLLMMLGLVSNALLARLLTPDELGAYFLMLSLTSAAVLVAQAGLNVAIVRFVSEAMIRRLPCRAARVIRLSIGIGAVLSLVIAALLWLGVGGWVALTVFHSTLLAGIVGLAAVWVILNTLQGLLAEGFRGFHDIRSMTFYGGLITSFITAGLLVYVWYAYGEISLETVVLMGLSATATSVLIGGWMMRLRLQNFQGEDNILVREMMGVAGPLGLTGLLLFALSFADLWVLGGYRSDAELAVYSATSRLVILVGIPLMVVNAVISPLIAEAYAAGDCQDLEQPLRATATIAGVPALCVLGGFFAFGGYLLSWLYGPYYQDGAVVLVLLSLGQVVNAWAGSCGLVLMMTGHQMVMLWITAVCGALTVLGCLWVVRDYGGVGVAAVAASAMMLQNGLMLLAVKQRLGIWTHLDLRYIPRLVRGVFP